MSGQFFLSKKCYTICLKIFFVTFTNNVDPDEMQHHAAFHLGRPCLQKYLFRGFPNTKVNMFNEASCDTIINTHTNKTGRKPLIVLSI